MESPLEKILDKTLSLSYFSLDFSERADIIIISVIGVVGTAFN